MSDQGTNKIELRPDPEPAEGPRSTEQRLDDLEKESRKRQTGIWLKVAEVDYDTDDKSCKVQFEGDRAHPRPVWWPVKAQALSSSLADPAYDTYKAILREMDRKRVAVGRLTWEDKKARLHCDSFRFQSAELGSR